MGKCVTHLIIGLGKGGAETMLYQVLKYKIDPDIQYKVISLGVSHYYEQAIEELGIPVVEADMQKRPLKSLIKIFQEIKGSDTLCCWMYHANLIGYYLGRLARVQKIIWCIRHSNLDQDKNNKNTLAIIRLCGKYSSKVSVISYNGEHARCVHEAIGYAHEKGIVLDNGVDCETYKPDDMAKANVCSELGITYDKKIILSITKDHPMKDIPTFIGAFSEFHKKKQNTVAVMCGLGIDPENKHISDLCLSNGLLIGTDIFLLGMRNDINHLLAACDVYVLHSAGEAFPNTLIQAMACGCVCVATDVGDVRRILEDDRWIVPSQSRNRLLLVLESLFCLSENEKKRIAIRNRNLSEQRFNIKEVVKKYEKIFN